jgi:hypothetical protein
MLSFVGREELRWSTSLAQINVFVAIERRRLWQELVPIVHLLLLWRHDSYGNKRKLSKAAVETIVSKKRTNKQRDALFVVMAWRVFFAGF